MRSEPFYKWKMFGKLMDAKRPEHAGSLCLYFNVERKNLRMAMSKFYKSKRKVTLPETKSELTPENQ